MFLKSCLSSFCKTTLVPQKDTPTWGCPGNKGDVRVDCGRSADSSEVHVPESNGRDVGRGTVEFNLRGWVRDDSVTATLFQGIPHCEVFDLLTVCKNGGGGRRGEGLGYFITGMMSTEWERSKWPWSIFRRVHPSTCSSSLFMKWNIYLSLFQAKSRCANTISQHLPFLKLSPLTSKLLNCGKAWELGNKKYSNVYITVKTDWVF